MKNCPSCQAQSDDGAMFCEECGTKFEAVQIPEPTPEVVIPDPIPEQAYEPQPDAPVYEAPAYEPPVEQAPPPQEYAPQAAPQPEYAPPPAYGQQAPQYPYPQQPVYPQQPAYQQPGYPAYPPPPPVYGYAPPPAYVMPAAPTGPSVDAVRAAGKSPLFVAAAIVMVLMIIMTVVSAVMPSSSIYFMPGGDAYDALEEAFEDFPVDISDSFNGSFGGGGGMSALPGALFSSIFPCLICIGMFMFYVSCRSPKPVSTGGLTLIKAMMIVYIVCIGIVAAIALPVLFLLLAGAGAANSALRGGGEGVLAIMWIIIAAAVFMITMAIIYYAKIIQTIGNVTQTLRKGRASSEVSMFVVVLNFFFALGSILSAVALFALPGIFNETDLYRELGIRLIYDVPSMIPSMLQSVLSAVLLVLVSVCMIKYKSAGRDAVS